VKTRQHCRRGSRRRSSIDVRYETPLPLLTYHDNSIGGSFIGRCRESGRAYRPDDERPQHASSRNKEELPSANSVDKEAHSNRSEEVYDLEDSVDKKLRLGIRYADQFQNLSHIVGNQALSKSVMLGSKYWYTLTVSRPLRKEPGGD
jgi:hypothetical protein